MSDIKLLPCPFCGSDRLYISERNYFGEKFVNVSCIECHISQTGNEFETKEEAIEKWNTRKPMDRIVEQLEDKAMEHAINGQQFGEDGWKDHEQKEILQQEAYEKAIEIVKAGGV